MGIANLHTTIDYKKLIEFQANLCVSKNCNNDKLKSNNKSYVKTKLIKRTTNK